MEPLYRINKYTGEFVSSETEKKFIDLSWPVLSRRLLIAVLLSSLTYFFASCIPRPEVNSEYRVLMIPLTRAVAAFILAIAIVIKKSNCYSLPLRIMIVLAEIFIGMLESADQYFYLKSINKFYDIGTSYLVFYILIFYIVIPNKIKLTFFTSIGISITFIISVYLTEVAAFSDLFTTAIYFIITNALGYGIVLTANRSKREEYYYGIQLKEAEKKAMEAKLTAEEANKAKSRFLAMMNHEMRTPLNVVLGGIQLLDNGSLPNEQQETLSIIRNSGELLKVLIQNVLDFTNMEKNKLQIRTEPFSLKQMIKEIETIYSRVSEEKGLGFAVSYKCDPIEYVAGDPVRLRQILINLLNNAVKFTNDGSVSLRIDLVEREDNNILLRFAVTDTGIGISEKHFDEIIKPFTQIDHSTTRNFDGSGLGLAICSELIAAMDSRLEIASKEDTGSTFSFIIPLKLADTTALPDEETLQIESFKILLIDDIEANLKIVGGLLESLGQQVVYARGSRPGIEKSLLDDFDAVIIDLHMPDKDGMETLREIKKNQPDITAFLMTADTREEVLIQGRDAGFTDFIQKPVDMFQLKEAVGKIMVISDGTYDIMDKKFIIELEKDLGDDVFVDVINSCIKTLEKDAMKIRDPDSIDNRDDFIHQLKGVAGNYRLIRLWKALKDFETDMSLFDIELLTGILDETIMTLKNIIRQELT